MLRTTCCTGCYQRFWEISFMHWTTFFGGINGILWSCIHYFSFTPNSNILGFHTNCYEHIFIDCFEETKASKFDIMDYFQGVQTKGSDRLSPKKKKEKEKKAQKTNQFSTNFYLSLLKPKKKNKKSDNELIWSKIYFKKINNKN